ncbi:homoserine kinase [Tenacibaculum adriaticum]|uniref:Homoserine kinase n=1 Tax=Tenacibaculum adriaticum TaxID=413713 RepID=A0A5S5DWL3_9FLAO|nr:homoserine kinase [Tenacibaculum adriaticum]TYP99162.1 homoserine kinase [Tenacibaculum adriaticum]
MNKIKIFSPATVANVSCGFDVLGLCLDNVGDEMTFTKTTSKEVIISNITGAKLPLSPQKNVAGAVALAMLKEANANFGVNITIHKGFTPGSGLGSSAASASGTAFAINKLLDNPFSKLKLTQFAMIGEKVACGSEIADNVAAAIHGGFILVRSYNPLEIVPIPTPSELRIVAIHPQVEVKTKDARGVLPEKISLKDAITQWGNVGGLISGLYTSDYDLIANSLTDVIVEPARKHLIPHFDLVKKEALKAGALGAGISGSGPTIFALCKGDEVANSVYKAINNSYKDKEINYHMISSKINTEGVKII